MLYETINRKPKVFPAITLGPKVEECVRMHTLFCVSWSHDSLLSLVLLCFLQFQYPLEYKAQKYLKYK